VLCLTPTIFFSRTRQFHVESRSIEHS
jgi:hypothetical protein